MSENRKRSNRLGRLWQHSGTFLFVLETDLGFRNGYMRVPEEHPWHKVLIDMDPQPPVDHNELIAAVNKQMEETGYTGPRMPRWPKELEDRMNAREWRMQVTWYEWMSGRIDVHGGWTFADFLTHKHFDEWVGEGSDGIPPGLWFGFDTGHYRDGHDIQLMHELGTDPKVIEIYANRSLRDPGEHIWTIDDVATELNRCAEELAAAKILAGVEQ